MVSASDAFGSSCDAKLPTTDEFITDPGRVSCPVLDTKSIDFSKAVWGRKTETTLVRRAKDGESLGQSFEGGKETFEYVTEEGDAIFVHSPTDQYVPPAKNGERLKFDALEKNGYKIVSGDAENVQVKSPPAQLLVGVVTGRVCIKNAWGPEDNAENDQFLSAGATLKRGADGKVTGIAKEGFEKWGIDADQTPEDQENGVDPIFTC
ncbi:MAG: hypothetical protein KAJ40_06325 [Alphaproteobacteria bacterium]|nr:hypothetical protein [Alphaproteobacteria bacterium]